MLASLTLPDPVQAGQLIKSYDAATGTDEPFSATGAWQVKWTSGERNSSISVRITDATTGAYVSEVEGISGAVRVDASGTFRITTDGGQSRYKITISKLP